MAEQTLSAPATVVVVDDDDDARTAVARLLSASGYVVRTYGDPTEFLSTDGIPASNCVVLDLCMPGLNGLEVQERIAAWPDPPAIVFVSGHARIADSVRAIQHGAVDFLIKSGEPAALLDAVARAIAHNTSSRVRHERERDVRSHYERLTAREREVLAHLIAGQLNKQIAFDLGIAERTIKIHRARVLQKMHAGSIADLVRIADLLAISPISTPEPHD